MKNFIFYLIAASASIAAASCKADNLTVDRSSHRQYDAISFRTDGLDIDVFTRTSATVSLTSFFASASTGTMGTSDRYAWKSVNFEKSGDVFTGNKYWPDEDPGYHFYASNVSMTCNDGSAPSVAVDGIEKDIVCAVCTSSLHKKVNTLTFNHIFARLGSVSVSGPDGYTLGGVSIKITPKTKGTYNLLTGLDKTNGTGWTGTSASTATEIANADGSTKENDIYLIPDSYQLSATYTLTKGDFTKEYTSSKNVSLTAGKVNKIEATISLPDDGGAQDIEFKVEVTPWKDNEMTITF